MQLEEDAPYSYEIFGIVFTSVLCRAINLSMMKTSCHIGRCVLVEMRHRKSMLSLFIACNFRRLVFVYLQTSGLSLVLVRD